MNRAFLSVCTLAVTAASLFMIDQSSTQNAVGRDVQPEGVVLTELSRLSYPPLARQVRISGDVDLMLRIRQDGSIESAVVSSGHPLLAQTALESAQRSRFECRKCSETVTSLRLVYTFQLVGPNSCCTPTKDGPKESQPGEQIPRVTQSLNHVIVIDQTACICDGVPDVGDLRKVRSAKCLYLWRCGTPRVRIYE
jgi:TonB family protein